MLLVLLSAWPCETWEPLAQLASIQHPSLTESSGLAPGRRTPGTVWTHDDSGDASLFRFSLDGVVTEHPVAGADNEDWEDLASADCPGSGECLYVGDIGIDRSNNPDEITVYVVREPAKDGSATLMERWELRWPGVVRDAETLLVHPCTLDAWIVTKGQPTEVFRIPDKRGRNRLDLEPVATLDLDQILTGGDFSPDGTALVLRSDSTAFLLPFDVDAPDAHWGDPPTLVVDGLAAGEGLGWDLDGDLLFSSEGFPTAINRMACAEAPPDVCSAPGSCGCQSALVGAGPWSLLGLYAKRR